MGSSQAPAGRPGHPGAPAQPRRERGGFDERPGRRTRKTRSAEKTCGGDRNRKEGGRRPSWQIEPSLGRASEEDDDRSSSSHPMWVSQTESCSAKAGQGSATPAPPPTTTFLLRARPRRQRTGVSADSANRSPCGSSGRAQSANRGLPEHAAQGSNLTRSTEVSGPSNFLSSVYGTAHVRTSLARPRLVL